MLDKISLCLVILLMILLAFILIKIRIDDKKYDKISYAIYLYNVDCYLKNEMPLVRLLDMASPEIYFSFKNVFKRNIPLSKEKYKIIKPYIKEVRKRRREKDRDDSIKSHLF